MINRSQVRAVESATDICARVGCLLFTPRGTAFPRTLLKLPEPNRSFKCFSELMNAENENKDLESTRNHSASHPRTLNCNSAFNS